MATVKVVVLGSSKESNHQFCLSVISGHGPKTQDITKKKDGHTYQLQFMNIDAQADRASLYNQANVFLILFNVDAEATFDSIQEQWIPEICEHVGAPAPIVIVGTNIDKRGKTGGVTAKQGEGFVARLKLAAYCECNFRLNSSVTKVVDIIFHTFMEDTKAKKDPKHPFYHTLLPWGKKPKETALRHSASNPIPPSYAKASSLPPPKSTTPPPPETAQPRKTSLVSPHTSAPTSRSASPTPIPPTAATLDPSNEIKYIELSHPATKVTQPPRSPTPTRAPLKKPPATHEDTKAKQSPPVPASSPSPASPQPKTKQKMNRPTKAEPQTPPSSIPTPPPPPPPTLPLSPPTKGLNSVSQNSMNTQLFQNSPVLLTPPNSSSGAQSSRSPATPPTPNTSSAKKFGAVEWDIPAKDLVFLNVLGKGAYGEVWKGKWTGRGGGLIVAIKKIPIWAIMVKLRYQAIVMIYGRAITEHELFIVLEYVEGGDLTSLLSSKSDIGWDLRIRLALQATRSVHYLHSLHPPVLHRDLKSPNFLVCKPSMDLKLTDFGMSKVKSIASTVTEVAAATAGSYRWSAPETIAKYPKWSEKADIFSLGMVFYEIAARRIPFEEVSESYHILFLIKSERERPDIPPDCPIQFAQIIEACWQHEPDARPTSSELLNLLQTLLENPINTTVPTTTRNIFFKVNEEELLRNVSPDCVRVLTQPPPFPSTTMKCPELPSKVTLVKISRPDNNPLLSKTYDAQLFERVEVYFRRFFDSKLKVTLDEVDVILNEAVERRFAHAESVMHEKFAGMAEMKDEDQSDLQHIYLNELLLSKNLVATRNSNPISAWHGANSNHLESICWYGMLNLSSTDPGYYGKGIYFTQLPNYGEYYAQACEARTEGKFQLLLCWILLGKPHAITKVAMGRQCEKGYTSHYTLVTKKLAARELCATKADFEDLEGLNNFFPVKSGDQVQGDEIALFDSCHVLPRFIVHYSVKQDPHEMFRGVSFYNPKDPKK